MGSYFQKITFSVFFIQNCFTWNIPPTSCLKFQHPVPTNLHLKPIFQPVNTVLLLVYLRLCLWTQLPYSPQIQFLALDPQYCQFCSAFLWHKYLIALPSVSLELCSYLFAKWFCAHDCTLLFCALRGLVIASHDKILPPCHILHSDENQRVYATCVAVITAYSVKPRV